MAKLEIKFSEEQCKKLFEDAKKDIIENYVNKEKFIKAVENYMISTDRKIISYHHLREIIDSIEED